MLSNAKGRFHRAYDAEGRIISAAGGGLNKYVYDADGKRVRRQVGAQQFWQVYGIDGELVAEYLWDGTTATLQKEYGYRSGDLLIVAEGAIVRWLVKDHLGTPRMIVDQTGSLSGMRRHDYYPFGEENLAGPTIRTAGNGYQTDNVRQKFTGYEHDGETDLDFAEARYCSTKQGRFTSPDPLLLSAETDDPQSWNRYSYVGNRPLSVTDPTGLRWAWKKSGDNYVIQYFLNDADALKEGWTIIYGAYTFTDIRGREITIYEDGSRRIFVPEKERESVLRDSELGNTIAKLIAFPAMIGAGIGSAGLVGSAAVAISIYEDESQGPLRLGTEAEGGVPNLTPLHDVDEGKLNEIRKMSTDEIIRSLKPGEPESLKVRPEGTILNGHHRIKVLQERGINVNTLPREIIPKTPMPELRVKPRIK